MAIDDDAQIDPATLPENIELMHKLAAAREPKLAAPASGTMRELLVEALAVTLPGIGEAIDRRQGTHPLEKDLRDGLAATLGRSDAVVFAEARMRLSGWTANLGGFDIAMVGTDGAVVLIETKWADGSLWQAVWDVLKLASAHIHPRVSAAYAVYTAPADHWGKYSGSELFTGWDARSFVTDYLLEESAVDWEKNLRGSTAYPTELPMGLDLKPVVTESSTVLGREYLTQVVSIRGALGKPLQLDRGRMPKKTVPNTRPDSGGH